MLALAHVAQVVGIFLGTALAFAVGLLCVLYLGTRQVGRPELRLRPAARREAKGWVAKRGIPRS